MILLCVYCKWTGSILFLFFIQCCPLQCCNSVCVEDVDSMQMFRETQVLLCILNSALYDCRYTNTAMAKLNVHVHKYIHMIFSTDKATSADIHRKKIKSKYQHSTFEDVVSSFKLFCFIQMCHKKHKSPLND